MTEVLYVVWGEDITSSAIFDNQVAELLLELKARGQAIRLLVGLPIPTLLRHGRFRPAALKASLAQAEAKLARLERAGIPVHVRRLYTAFSFYAPLWALPFYYLGHLGFFRRLATSTRVKIVHCRSYHAALLAHLAHRRGGDFAIIFDARSLFPEEGVVTGRYREGGLSFRLWKNIERRLVRGSVFTVSVTERNSAFLRADEPTGRFVTIRPCVNTRGFQGVAAPAGDPVWVYSGTLSKDNPWYSPVALAKMVLLGRQVFGGLRLLVLTTREHDWIRSQLVAAGLDVNSFDVRAASGIDAVARELTGAHCGLLPLLAPRDECLRKIFAGGLSSKTGEYLAAGLPVICDRELGEVADLVAAHGIGITLAQDPQTALDQLRNLRDNYPQMRRRCLDVSHMFSLDHVASGYERLYASAGPTSAHAPACR